MKIEPQSIDQTLELIAHGQLDPLQAARTLLGLLPPEQPPAEPTEQPPVQRQSLDRLVRTLGMPPPEIEHDWRQQIQSLTHSWQQTHRVPLPALELSDLWVDADNRLSLRSETLAANPQAATVNLVQGLGEAAPASEQPEVKPDAPVPDSPAVKRNSASVSGPEPAKSAWVWRRTLTLTATALAASAAAALLWGTYFRTQPEPHGGQTRGGDDRLVREAQGVATPATPPGLPTNSSQSPTGQTGTPIETLETLLPRSADTADLAFPADLLGPDNPLLNDVLAGLAADIVPLTAAATVPQEASDPLIDDRSASLGDTGVAAEADDTAPPAVPQQRPTRSATSDAITLPPLPAVGQTPEPESIFGSPVSDLRWEFPLPTTLVLRSIAAGQWNLIDLADDMTVASFRSGEQGLEFSWDEAAASKPAARQLPAGRLQLTGPALGTPQILWLRPQLKSEPFRFDFAEAQVAASWPLGGPAVFPAGELTVDLDVPDSVQMSWIEPLDPHNLRRGVALLQWAPANAETPLIRCRMELRVAANLSLKLRYAAQLDPTLPWQSLSRGQLERTVDRVAIALNQLLAQQSELARQYSAASTTSRRLLKPAKDAVDQNVQRLQMLLQRMQQLIALQAAVATESRLRIALTTHWPDQRQTILEMTGDDQLDASR